MGDPVAPHHDRRPQAPVPAAEVHDAVAQVLPHALVGERASLEVLFPPLLRHLHQLQRLPVVPARAAQEPGRHRRDRGEELDALLKRLVLQLAQPLQLLRLQLGVAVDLPLLVAVLEVRKDLIGRRLIRERLRGQGEPAHVVVLDDDGVGLRLDAEAALADVGQLRRQNEGALRLAAAAAGSMAVFAAPLLEDRQQAHAWRVHLAEPKRLSEAEKTPAWA
mmetsp:Transcript_58337/g.151616  ORF Transcript_58337/g.151616 Transcript_58337/m.151616 type:complete len:220 (+) Transcript_58337:1043-1702(+)